MTSGTHSPVRTDLSVFRDPASVAVVGASANPAKWGYWLAAGALAGEHRREVHLVNSRATEVLGRACASSLSELERAPELVALCVPPAHIGAVVDEALALGTRGFLGITAGVPREAELAARIRSAGARLIGANSLGLVDSGTQLQLAWGSFMPGPVAIVSQSGQLGSEIAQLGQRVGLGVSRFISIGNQSDVTAVDVLEDLVDDAGTSAIIVYVESFDDGERLFAQLRRLRGAGKPVALLTIGASAASARLARSHTGSLTSSSDLVDAACRANGVIRAATPAEAVDAVRLLLHTPAPRGRRIALVGDSGGQCGIGADLSASRGLVLPELSELLTAQLAARLPAGAAVSNPVDLAGAGEEDLGTYGEIAASLLSSDDVDAIVLTGYFGRYAIDTPTLADVEIAHAHRMGAAAAAAGKPLFVHSMGVESPTATALWDAGVPTFGTIEQTLRAVEHAASAVVPSDAVAEAVPGTWTFRAGYGAAQEALSPIVQFPVGRTVHSAEDVRSACEAMPGPWVLKAAWLEHKSEVGGVRIGLARPEEAVAAFTDMSTRLGDGEYVLEAMDRRADTVEVLIGARRDPGLGPIVVVGAGGVEAEALQDVCVELAPVSRERAETMLQRLRVDALLRGWRGRPPVDREALLDTIVGLSRFIQAEAAVAEVELNPVRVSPDGAIAVDALIIPVTPEGTTP